MTRKAVVTICPVSYSLNKHKRQRAKAITSNLKNKKSKAYSLSIMEDCNVNKEHTCAIKPLIIR